MIFKSQGLLDGTLQSIRQTYYFTLKNVKVR